MNWIHNIYHAWHIISGICIIWVAWNYWNNRDCISETLTESECNHHGVDNGGTDYYGTSNPPQECDWNYSYCPKCGEKL